MFRSENTILELEKRVKQLESLHIDVTTMLLGLRKSNDAYRSIVEGYEEIIKNLLAFSHGMGPLHGIVLGMIVERGLLPKEEVIDYVNRIYNEEVNPELRDGPFGEVYRGLLERLQKTSTLNIWGR